MIRKKPGLGLDPRVGTGFPRDKRENAFARRSCSNKKIERDDDSKKSHPALAAPRSRQRLAYLIDVCPLLLLPRQQLSQISDVGRGLLGRQVGFYDAFSLGKTALQANHQS